MSHIKNMLCAFMVCAAAATVVSCGGETSNTEINVSTEKSFNKIKGVTSYRRSFGDLNDVHLSSAKKNGIKPVSDRKEAEKHIDDLLFIGENRYYSVDKLTHSIPYLVPKASALLMAIGMNFQDSLKAKGLDEYKLIVTSVLRTKDDVKRLRKRNSNASMNSAHFYGTTFDISYNRFNKVLQADSLAEERDVKLKLVLSEVLRDLKQADLCYVKYELKQGCFHITAR